MDQDQPKNVASETEIPVESATKEKSKLPLPNVNKKILAVGALVLVLLLIGIFLVFFANNKPSSEKEMIVNEYYQNAENESKAGNYTEAQKQIESGLKIDGNNTNLLSSMINLKAAEGNRTGKETESLKEAQKYIDKALDVDPENLNVLTAVGYAYEAAGDYNLALKYYTEATKLFPESDRAWFSHGHVLQFLGKNDEAYVSYEKAYALDPDNAQILMVMGNKLVSENKLQEAFELFIKASEQEGISVDNKAEALTAAAIIRRDQDNYKYIFESLDLSEEAVKISPNFSPALAALGYTLSIVHEADDAISYLKKAIAANPRIANNYYLLGVVYTEEVKNYSEAINYNKQALLHIANDNTILSSSDKDLVRGKFLTYQAMIYDQSGLQVDVMPILKQAIILNPAMRSKVSILFNDHSYFENLANNQEFITLINTQ